MSCWEVELDRNGSNHSLPTVINTLEKILFTQKEKGRQIITFIGHSFSNVNKDLLEKTVSSKNIFFLSISKIPLAQPLYITPIEDLISA